jgi:hypothetical protein
MEALIRLLIVLTTLAVSIVVLFICAEIRRARAKASRPKRSLGQWVVLLLHRLARWLWMMGRAADAFVIAYRAEADKQMQAPRCCDSEATAK